MRRAAVLGSSPRRGVALVAALGLLLLAAALLAGGAASAVELRRATRTVASAQRAHAEGRHGLGSIMQSWGIEEDSLPVGAVLHRTLAAPSAGPPIVVVGAIQRLTSSLWAVDMRVRVGADPPAPALATRRVRLLLQRAASIAAGGEPTPVVPIARWSIIDRH